MADVVCGVAGFLHGADGDGLDEVFFFLSLDVLEQAVDGLRKVVAVACRTQLVSEAADELCQVVQLGGVGQVVYAVRENLGFFAFGNFSDGFGDGAVGQQHELLHQLVGIFRLLEVYAQRLSLVVYLELHFHPVELQCAVGEAFLAQYLGQAVQFQQFELVVALARLDDLLRLFVGEAPVALDDGVHDAVVQHFGLVVEGEDDAVCQLLFVGAEGAQKVAEAFGEHGDGAVYEVDRRGALLGFLVDDAAFLDVMRYVGDVHAHFPQPASQAADGQGVVEVLGVLGVDGEGGDVAEVLATGYFLGGDFVGNLVGRCLHVFRIIIRQAKLCQDGVHFCVVFPRPSQDIYHLSNGVFRLVWPFDDFHYGFVSALAAFQLVFGDEYVVGQSTVLGQ